MFAKINGPDIWNFEDHSFTRYDTVLLHFSLDWLTLEAPFVLSLEYYLAKADP